MKLHMEKLNQLIPFRVRRTHYERNQLNAVRPEPVLSLAEGAGEGR